MGRGVPEAFLRVLISYYSDLDCCFVMQSGCRAVVSRQMWGIRMSGILSPYLFSIHVDDLLTSSGVLATESI